MGRTTHDTSERLADVSMPKIRKIIHKVLTKHYDDRFYQKIDLIKKVLRKLKVHPVGCNETARIRNMINRWICTNRPTDDSNIDKKDVKTGIPKINDKSKNTDAQQTRAADKTNNESVQVSSEVVPIAENPSNEQQAVIDKPIKESVQTEIVPIISPTKLHENAGIQINIQEAPIKSSVEIEEKIIPLIDLTILDVDEIKKEPVKDNENSNAALENKVDADVIPGYNYQYYYGYPYYPYDYNYNYNYYCSWYQAYYNGYTNYNQYNTYTNWNGVYSSEPINHTDNNNSYS